LAEKELREEQVLSQFLPSLLSESDIDAHLQKILDDSQETPPRLGNIFKAFYNIVDKSTVDPTLVKKRLELMLQLETDKI
jgi:uncharacterized protein YqeY